MNNTPYLHHPDAITDKEKYEYLLRRAQEFLIILEGRLGKRDRKFRLGNIYWDTDDRYAYIYPSAEKVDIYLTKKAVLDDNARNAEWQLAHECVHLLDPNYRCDQQGNIIRTNVLEEGIASWFHDTLYPEFRNRRPKNYKQARDLVEKYLDHGILEHVKLLREKHGFKIHNIQSKDLLKIPGLRKDDAKILAHKFSDTGTINLNKKNFEMPGL